MTGASPTGHSTATHPTAETAAGRRSAVLAPLAALVLAAGAIAGAYATSNQDTSAPPPTGVVSSARLQTVTAPPLQGAFPAEPGPEGAEGQWVGDAASVTVAGFKQSWIAFRGLSLRRDRTLTMTPSRGGRVTTRIGRLPGIYVAGPFQEGTVTIRSTPGAAVASRTDRRRVSVFLSTLRTIPEPLAALPGAGFWGVERVQGLAFNWLRDAGVIDVYSPRIRAGSIWLTFVGRSLAEDRTLTASDGSATSRVQIGTSGHLVRIGPFPLVRGRARVLLQPSPGARRYGGDPRPLSIQMALLAAHTSATEE